MGLDGWPGLQLFYFPSGYCDWAIQIEQLFLAYNVPMSIKLKYLKPSRI
jgi:hypothetical protein